METLRTKYNTHSYEHRSNIKYLKAMATAIDKDTDIYRFELLPKVLCKLNYIYCDLTKRRNISIMCVL